jgi:hypothetical protein
MNTGLKLVDTRRSATTLGALLAIVLSDDHSPGVLLFPAVAPVVLLASTLVAVLITPVTVWALRTGTKNLWRYGPVLWLVLAMYILFAIPHAGHYGQYGLVAIAVLGLIIIGCIPATDQRSSAQAK